MFEDYKLEHFFFRKKNPCVFLIKNKLNISLKLWEEVISEKVEKLNRNKNKRFFFFFEISHCPMDLNKLKTTFEIQNLKKNIKVFFRISLSIN